MNVYENNCGNTMDIDIIDDAWKMCDEDCCSYSFKNGREYRLNIEKYA